MPLLATRGSASARALALDGFQRARVSFAYVSNALQAFTVPAGVTRIAFEVTGGGGGVSNDYRGGGGAQRVTGALTTTPGSTLYIAAAQGGDGGFISAPDPFFGTNVGGWPGGGDAGFPTFNYYPSAFASGGGGGGYSGIFSANALTQGNALVIAAGGGGSGGDASYFPGQPGTLVAGGARGGEGQPNNNAASGSALQGGKGDDNSYVNPSFSYPAGGGGGGYFGGGGGYSEDGGFGRWGPGGRGSSYTSPSVSGAVISDTSAFNGYAILSW